MVVTPPPVRPRPAGWQIVALCGLGLVCLWLSALLFMSDPEPPAEAPTGIDAGSEGAS
jgi:hypothetical protein